MTSEVDLKASICIHIIIEHISFHTHIKRILKKEAKKDCARTLEVGTGQALVPLPSHNVGSLCWGFILKKWITVERWTCPYPHT